MHGAHTETNAQQVWSQSQARATMTAREAATYLGISYWLILELVKRGELNCVKAGGRKLFRQSGLDDWMNRQEAGEVRDERPALRRAK